VDDIIDNNLHGDLSKYYDETKINSSKISIVALLK